MDSFSRVLRVLKATLTVNETNSSENIRYRQYIKLCNYVFDLRENSSR